MTRSEFNTIFGAVKVRLFAYKDFNLVLRGSVSPNLLLEVSIPCEDMSITEYREVHSLNLCKAVLFVEGEPKMITWS
jgi:hypothetical protein